MTPEQLAVIASFVSIISGIGNWPFGVIIFFIVVGPWIAALLLAYLQTRRFERVVDMYESNVELVRGYRTLAGDLRDIIIMNTKIITKQTEAISQNQFCPSQRIDKKQVMVGP